MKLALVATLVPALALAQGAPPPSAAPPAAATASAPTGRSEHEKEHWKHMEKRMRLARALGLAEALDLDEAQATRMNQTMVSFDARRKPLFEQLWAGVKVLHEAARMRPSKDAAAAAPPNAQAVDQAVSGIFDAREKLSALDREMFQTLSKGLGPEQRARMALFFARFRQRFHMAAMGMMMRHGMPVHGAGPEGCPMCGKGGMGGMGHMGGPPSPPGGPPDDSGFVE